MLKKSQTLLVTAAIMLFTAFSTDPNDKKTVPADVAGSRVTLTGTKTGEPQAGYIKLLSGNLKLEENQVKGGSFTMDMNSITDPQAQDSKLESLLKSPGYFDARKFPTAGFVITEINRLPVKEDGEIKATHRIEGNLTVKGVTRKVSFDASVNVLKGKVALSSQPFTIHADKFGTPGDLRIQLEIVSK